MLNPLSKAVVFDLGGVVIDWRPEIHANHLLPGLSAQAAISLVFQDFSEQSDWVLFDRGNLNAKQCAERIAVRCGLSEALVQQWIKAIPESFQLLSESVDWIKKIKSLGFETYYLSNMPAEFATVLRKREEFISLFNNGIFSGEIGLSKPDRRIFDLASEQFGLNQNKVWHFLDDNLFNIEAAKEVGWRATHFKSPQDFLAIEVSEPFRPRRSIRSYVLRGGRMGSGQIRAIDTLSEAYCIQFKKQPLSVEYWNTQDHQKPLLIEIGFGMGHSTADMALALPRYKHLGIEVHAPGVGSLLSQIRDRSITNLRIIQHDAVEVLSEMIPERSVAAFHIFFPDPWPKKRHHKRRLMQARFVSLLSSRLIEEGYVHCATDWEPYARSMLEILSAEPTLKNTSTDFCERPSWRVLTKFEHRGLSLGHQAWDLVFKKRRTTGE
jgi:tRNA (guanine-N7-)-methyltransferase